MLDLKRPKEMDDHTVGICGGHNENNLFFVDSKNGAVRSLNVHTAQLSSDDIYRCQDGEEICDVAFCAEWDTLLIAIKHLEKLVLLLFVCNNGKWIGIDRLSTGVRVTSSVIIRFLPDGTLFCSQILSDTVLVYYVDAERWMDCIGSLTLPKRHWGFDVQLVGEEIRLVAAFCDNSVAVLRVEEKEEDEEEGKEEECTLKLTLIHSIQLHRQPRYPLFCGDALLVQMEADDSNSHKVVAIPVTEDSLQCQRKRVLHTFDGQFCSKVWCYVHGTLVVHIPQNKTLQLFTVEYS